MWLIFYTSKNPFNWEIFHKWTISNFLITNLSDMIGTEEDLKKLCAKSWTQFMWIANMVKLDKKQNNYT